MNIRIELTAAEVQAALAEAMRAKLKSLNLDIPVDPIKIRTHFDGGVFDTEPESAFVELSTN